MCFVLEGVNGIDDVIVGVETEGSRGGCIIYLTECLNVARRVDVEQTFAQHFYLRTTNGLGGGRQLTVDVTGTDYVAVNDGEVADAGTDKGFGTPGTDAPYSEEYDANGGKPLKGFIA